MANSVCKICLNKTKKIYITLPLFRHLDFKTDLNNIVLKKCMNCQIIYNSKKTNNMSNLFRKKSYSLSKQTNHFVRNNQDYKRRTYYQAEIIYKMYRKSNKINVLDVGCFDGQLLLDMSKFFKKYNFFGYDINKQLKRLFPKKKNFKFVTPNLRNINEKFDLIIMSHSIMYINKIKDDFLLYKKMLKRNGILYIQMPNIEKNPFYALMGDQFNFFTSESLKNVLKICGFKSKIINNNIFKREIIMIAKKHNYRNKLKFKNSKVYEKCIIKIRKIIDDLAKFNKKKLIVMGTTVNSAFVDEILFDKIKFFIDENLSNKKNIFRGKKVVHPNKLSKNHNIILPYTVSNKSILNKFKNIYKGKFFLI